jgi:regulation of enolase protein 1 (concanavalin A-like superfamily)
MYGDNRNAPRLLKAITGDFQIETRVHFSPAEDYQGAGILIYVDGVNYIRFERAFGGVGEGGGGIRLDVRSNDKYEALATPADLPTTAPEVDLKVVRRGNRFSAYWRLDENGEWREAGEFDSQFPETLFAGIVGCNTAKEIAAEFKYIRVLPQPADK